MAPDHLPTKDRIGRFQHVEAADFVVPLGRQLRQDQVARLAEQELRRRLARYQLTDRLMREKYGMTLEEFEAAETVKARGYSFEVENDHQDWDLAVDGIRTIEHQLAALRGEE